jgi:hypothetical protein
MPCKCEMNCTKTAFTEKKTKQKKKKKRQKQENSPAPLLKGFQKYLCAIFSEI